MWHGGTIPSWYGSEALFYQKGGEEAKVAAGVASGVASGASTAMAAAGGMASVAAGVSTIPVAGWIAGAAIATAASVTALVGAIQSRKIKNAQAVKVAKALGLPNPQSIPGYVRRALKADEFKLRNRYLRARRKYLRLKRKGKLGTKRGKRAKAKYLLAKAILTIQRRNRRQDLEDRINERMGRRFKQDALERLRARQAAITASAQPAGSVSPWALAAAGAVLVAVVYAVRRLG